MLLKSPIEGAGPGLVAFPFMNAQSVRNVLVARVGLLDINP